MVLWPILVYSVPTYSTEYLGWMMLASVVFYLFLAIRLCTGFVIWCVLFGVPVSFFFFPVTNTRPAAESSFAIFLNMFLLPVVAWTIVGILIDWFTDESNPQR